MCYLTGPRFFSTLAADAEGELNRRVGRKSARHHWAGTIGIIAVVTRGFTRRDLCTPGACPGGPGRRVLVQVGCFFEAFLAGSCRRVFYTFECDACTFRRVRFARSTFVGSLPSERVII